MADKVEDSGWLDRAGQAGLAARGFLYVVVGVLAVQVAFGDHERADREGALEAVARQPFGRWLLVIVCVGLVGMVAWRLALAFLDPGDQGDDASGLATRAGNVGRALLYVGALASALPLVLGGQGNGHKKEQDWTARALELPGGRWLVAAAGVGIVATAVWNGWKAVTGKWRKKLETQEMTAAERRWAAPIAVLGLLGRMLVFALVGGFLIRAGVRYDPQQGVGLDAALKEVGAKQYGPWALTVLAAALVLFGLFSFLQARWRRKTR
jgi:hypothetical protein